MTKRFYDTLDGRCKPVNNAFKSQFERLSWKERALSVVSFIAGVGIMLCLTVLAFYLSRP